MGTVSAIMFMVCTVTVRICKSRQYAGLLTFLIIILQKNVINLENLLTLLELLIDEDDCQKLLKYFKVPSDKAKTIRESDEPSKYLLQHLRETGKLSAGDISLLLKGCNDEGISKVAEAWTNYQQFLSSKFV